MIFIGKLIALALVLIDFLGFEYAIARPRQRASEHDHTRACMCCREQRSCDSC